MNKFNIGDKVVVEFDDGTLANALVYSVYAGYSGLSSQAKMRGKTLDDIDFEGIMYSYLVIYEVVDDGNSFLVSNDDYIFYEDKLSHR